MYFFILLSMSPQERDISPNPFEEGVQGELLTAEFSRQEFLRKPDAFSYIADAPRFVTDTLRYLAGNSLVKGFAVIVEQEGNGFLFKAFKESLAKELDSFRAEETIRDISLRMNNGAMESVYMEGKTFEELEQEVRQYTSETPGIMLLGIIKFTD